MKNFKNLIFLASAFVGMLAQASIHSLDQRRVEKRPHLKVRRGDKTKTAFVWQLIDQMQGSSYQRDEAMKRYVDLVHRDLGEDKTLSDPDLSLLIEDYLLTTQSYEVARMFALQTRKTPEIVAFILYFNSTQFYTYNLPEELSRKIEGQVRKKNLAVANEQDIVSSRGHIHRAIADDILDLIMGYISTPPLSPGDMQERLGILEFWNQFVNFGGNIKPFIVTINQVRSKYDTSIFVQDFIDDVIGFIAKAPRSSINLTKIMGSKIPGREKLIKEIIEDRPEFQSEIENAIVGPLNANERASYLKIIDNSKMSPVGALNGQLDDTLRAEMLIFAPNYYSKFLNDHQNIIDADLRIAEQINVELRQIPTPNAPTIQNFVPTTLSQIAFLSQVYLAALHEARFTPKLQENAVSFLIEDSQKNIHREGLSTILADYLRASDRSLPLSEVAVSKLVQIEGQNKKLGIFLAADLIESNVEVQDQLIRYLDNPIYTRELFAKLNQSPSRQGERLKKLLGVWWISHSENHKVLKHLVPKLPDHPCEIILFKPRFKTLQPE